MGISIIKSCGFESDIIDRKKPKNIDLHYNKKLFSSAPESVKRYARTLIDQGWVFYTVSQDRGYCSFHSKTITIPVWAFSTLKRPEGFLTWYICHEMAHAYDECKHAHGAEFMQWLIKICPPAYLFHELEYKPKNAKASGIYLLNL